jgi:hypothetical protein
MCTCIIGLDHLFLRIGTSGLLPPGFLFFREGIKWDACFAKAAIAGIEVGIGLTPGAGIAVVAAVCGGAAGD